MRGRLTRSGEPVFSLVAGCVFSLLAEDLLGAEVAEELLQDPVILAAGPVPVGVK
jgi:hypothetical protein